MMQNMNDLIQRRIQERIEEARNKGLFKKTSKIAETFGEHAYKSHGYMHFFRDGDLQIEYDDYGNNLTVLFMGEVVFDVHLGSIEGYRPGRWESIIQYHWLRYLKLEEKKKKQEEKSLARTLLLKWGIDTGGLTSV